MTNIGWFVWWVYKDHSEKWREFYSLYVHGFHKDSEELYGEAFVKDAVNRMQQFGKKYDMPIIDCGYEDAFVEECNERQI